MSTDTIQAPNKEALVVRDLTGGLRQYSLEQVMSKIMPANLAHPERDAAAFVSYCLATGANPFAKEVVASPFNTKVSMKGQPPKYERTAEPILTLQYFNRLASEDPDFDGMETYFIDGQGNRVPKTAELGEPGDLRKIVGACCRVWFKGRRLPVEAVVLLTEVDKDYGILWDPLQKKHGLEVRVQCRALRQAFPPKAALPRVAAESGAAAIEAGAAGTPRVIEAELEAEVVGQELKAEEQPGLTLAAFGKWCKGLEIPPELAEQAKAACGLAAQNWKGLEGTGALETIQARLEQWREEGVPEDTAEPPPEPEEEFAPEAEAGAVAPLPAPADDGELPGDPVNLGDLRDACRSVAPKGMKKEGVEAEIAACGDDLDALAALEDKWVNVGMRGGKQQTLGGEAE